jgi:glutathione S-transferase
LAFVYAGQEFEDHRIQFSEWEQLKPRTPFGSLPVLETTDQQGNKHTLAQSLSIARFLGRELNLSGHSSLEQAQVDQ